MWTIILPSLLLGITVTAIPSIHHDGIFEHSVLSWEEGTGSETNVLEMRAIYGGRKKRFVLDPRSSSKCCRNTKCPTVLGQIIDENCKCKKCQQGVPSLDGLSCTDNCPQGQEKNGQGGCCPIGQKPKASGDGCEEDPERARKGRCPDDTVLDPKEGPQDLNMDNPRCAIDDEKDCPKPNLPATRPDGAENDATFTPKCGKPDDNNRAKCDPKTKYVFVQVNADDEAIETCRQHRQYSERKKKKPQQLKAKLKEKWNADKPDRDAKEQARKEKLQQLQKHKEELEAKRQEMEKISEANEKKKTRIGKCAPVVALIVGVYQNDRVDEKREETEHPYDWTTDYFDEDFIHSDNRLSDWPQDVNVDEIAFVTDVGVDSEKWMQYWESFASTFAEELYSCSNAKRALEQRCWQRRSLDDMYTNVSTTNNNHPSQTTSEILLSDRTDLIVRNVHLEKRFFQIFVEIALFATRLGMSLMARTAATLSRWAPRLARLAQNQDRLFQIAKPGQGAAKGVDGMKNAFSRIIQNPEFRQCVKEGIPEVFM